MDRCILNLTSLCTHLMLLHCRNIITVLNKQFEISSWCYISIHLHYGMSQTVTHSKWNMYCGKENFRRTKERARIIEHTKNEFHRTIAREQFANKRYIQFSSPIKRSAQRISTMSINSKPCICFDLLWPITRKSSSMKFNRILSFFLSIDGVHLSHLIYHQMASHVLCVCLCV